MIIIIRLLATELYMRLVNEVSCQLYWKNGLVNELNLNLNEMNLKWGLGLIDTAHGFACVQRTAFPLKAC